MNAYTRERAIPYFRWNSTCLIDGTVRATDLCMMHSSHMPRRFEGARITNLMVQAIRFSGKDASHPHIRECSTEVFCLPLLCEGQNMQCFAVEPAVHNPDPSIKSNFEHSENQNGGLLEGIHGHRSGHFEINGVLAVKTQVVLTGLVI